jgi:hypothetical protein
MRKLNILLFIMIIIFYNGCKKDYTFNNNNNIESNNNSIELYKEIIDLINSNKEHLVCNTSKTLEHYGLWKDELDFQMKRLDFFIALLNNDKEIIDEYYIISNNFYYKIPLGNRDCYYSTKQFIDVQLFNLLENNFSELKLPINIINIYIGYDKVKRIDNN